MKYKQHHIKSIKEFQDSEKIWNKDIEDKKLEREIQPSNMLLFPLKAFAKSGEAAAKLNHPIGGVPRTGQTEVED